MSEEIIEYNDWFEAKSVINKSLLNEELLLRRKVEEDKQRLRELVQSWRQLSSFLKETKNDSVLTAMEEIEKDIGISQKSLNTLTRNVIEKGTHFPFVQIIAPIFFVENQDRLKPRIIRKLDELGMDITYIGSNMKYFKRATLIGISVDWYHLLLKKKDERKFDKSWVNELEHIEVDEPSRADDEIVRKFYNRTNKNGLKLAVTGFQTGLNGLDNWYWSFAYPKDLPKPCRNVLNKLGFVFVQKGA